MVGVLLTNTIMWVDYRESLFPFFALPAYRILNCANDIVIGKPYSECSGQENLDEDLSRLVNGL